MKESVKTKKTQAWVALGAESRKIKNTDFLY